jgi:hypothetical protein
MHTNFSPAWPHGEIIQIFEDIFMVTGTNIIVHDGVRIQTSRNMLIVRQKRELTLINSVRLSDNGLESLEKLGHVKNIIRIGAFHGRDDAFYQSHYNAHFWSFSSLELSHGERIDFDLNKEKLPLENSQLFVFETTSYPEGIIILNIAGGVLISCDSIKNWTKKDKYFDKETFALMKSLGSIGEAQIDATWLQAMKPSREDFEKILCLSFEHLVSAHGEPLRNKAKNSVQDSIINIMPFLNK